MSGQTKIVLVVVAFFALAGLFVRVAVAPAGNPPPAAPAPPTDLAARNSPTALPASVTPASASGPVQISIVTTDTKAEWLIAVTKDFNNARRTIAAGNPITVTVLQRGGPDEFEEVLLNGAQFKPVLASPGDISWMEKTNQTLKDLGQRQFPTDDCPPIAWIPAGFVMWEPMAKTLGWPDKPIGWKTIVDLAGDPQGWERYGHPEWGPFTFGHSHPVSSTFGFNSLASLAYAAAGKTRNLTPQDIRGPSVVNAFRKVEQETYHYGTSTSAILKLMVKNGQKYLHATTASETSFLYDVVHKQESLKPPWTWAFIFPAEGTFWSDNPTCILSASWVSQEQREAARIYRDYLLGPAAQERAVQIGIRPANPDIALHCPICSQMGTNPSISPATVPPLASVSGDANAAIIDVFYQTKKKATVALLLDTSSSMEGVAIKSAVAAAGGFLDRLHADDEVEAYVFNDNVTRLAPSGRAGDVSERLSEIIANLYADGNTALYDAVCTAVERIEILRQEDEAAGEARLYAVVLLSDGRNTNIKKWKSENEMLSCLPNGEDVREVKIYTIAYSSQADKDLLQRIAGRTNGKFYESNPENIAAIYTKIAAEQ